MTAGDQASTPADQARAELEKLMAEVLPCSCNAIFGHFDCPALYREPVVIALLSAWTRLVEQAAKAIAAEAALAELKGRVQERIDWNDNQAAQAEACGYNTAYHDAVLKELHKLLVPPASPPAQAMTAEEFAARIHFMARDVIPRPTLTIGDVIDIVKERDALLLAAAHQTWEAERAALLRRIEMLQKSADSVHKTCSDQVVEINELKATIQSLDLNLQARDRREQNGI